MKKIGQKYSLPNPFCAISQPSAIRSSSNFCNRLLRSLQVLNWHHVQNLDIQDPLSLCPPGLKYLNAQLPSKYGDIAGMISVDYTDLQCIYFPQCWAYSHGLYNGWTQVSHSNITLTRSVKHRGLNPPDSTTLMNIKEGIPSSYIYIISLVSVI